MFLLFLICIGGCVFPPEHAAWRQEQKAVQPMGGEEKPSGSLVVETVCLGTENGDELRMAFFLYDEQGRYLTHYPNRFMSPVPLPAGRYVVVTSILNTNKRAQVVIREGLTTSITLNDFRSAPEAE